MISPLGNKLTSIKYEDKEINKVYYEDKLVYKKPIYTPVTAIVASNKEQWVDTGLGKGWWTDLIKFEAKAMFSEVSAAVFGQRAADKMYDYDLVFTDSATNKIQFRIRNNDTDSSIRSDATPKFGVPIVMSYLSDSEFYVDDQKCTAYKWTDVQNFVLKNSFHLFRFNQYYDTGMGYNDNGTRTIYYIKMWYDDRLMLDYIPVLDKDGIPCFFDKVTQKFIYSAGPQPLEYIE